MKFLESSRINFEYCKSICLKQKRLKVFHPKRDSSEKSGNIPVERRSLYICKVELVNSQSNATTFILN